MMFQPLTGDNPISMAGVEAVKDVYPAIYEDTRNQIRDAHTDGLQDGHLLPSAWRTQLALAFELPELEPGFAPSSLATVSQAYQQTSQQPQGQPAPGGAPVDLSSIVSTTRDRMEGDYR